jgi:hypothetical protein
MNEIVDLIINNICLDDRISDGIFDIQNEEHMTVLREYFINRGIPVHEAIALNNRMLEGKYPERQAYNKDGILVTFPTPKHKQRAISRGTHFEKNPNPQHASVNPEESPDVGTEVGTEVGAEESPDSSPENIPTTPDPSLMFVTDPTTNTQLKTEPVGGSENSPIDPDKADVTPTPDLTPLRKKAEKEVAQQIIDDPDQFEMGAPVTDLYRESFLNELYQIQKYAKENGLKGAYTFISKIIK